jgi:hypothetical protein
MHDLRFAVERAILTKFQVSEVAELVEGDDVGDFSGFFWDAGSIPEGPSVRRNSVRRCGRTVPSQPGMSFSS